MNWQNLQPWLAPAVILSAAAFLSRFFGKVITDQKAFSDNRDWDVEFFGIWFLADFLFPPAVIAIALLSYFKGVILENLNAIAAVFFPLTYHWVDLAVVFLIILYCAIAGSIIARERYNVSRIMPNISEATNNKRFIRIINMNAALLQFFVVLLVLVFGIEVIAGNIFWITAFSIELFSALLLIALNYSLMKHSFPKINVFYISKKIPSRNVMLLKMNEDTLKIRKGEKTVIIERSDLLRIEILDSAQEKQFERSIIPFATWIPFLLSVFLLWNHEIFPAILMGIVFPTLLYSIGAWLFGVSPAEKEKLKLSLTGEIQKFIALFSMPIIIASIIACAALIMVIIGAWEHYGSLLFYGGILPTFVSSALWQIYYPR